MQVAKGLVMQSNASIDMLETVAHGLGLLLNDVVFIGGAVASLYIDDPGTFYIRPTKDVDCIIEITGRQNFSNLEESLRSRGFANDTSDDAPICRWIYNDIQVDIMPTDERILGFTNRWYKGGISHLTKANLPSGIEISLLSLPYFIATKIEAFHGRNEGDFRISHDIEDIINIMDGILSFNIIYYAPRTVKLYLVEQFRAFMNDSVFIESISSHIERGQSPARTKRVIDFLNDFCNSGKRL